MMRSLDEDFAYEQLRQKRIDNMNGFRCDCGAAIGCTYPKCSEGVDSMKTNEEYRLLEQQLADAQKQIVMLRGAFINARHALQLANDTPNGPICDTVWMMHSPETLFDFMDATISQTKHGNL